jgi:hypothetical protein
MHFSESVRLQVSDLIQNLATVLQFLIIPQQPEIATTPTITVNPKSRSENRRGEESQAFVRCSHCWKAGHTADACWHLYPHLRLIREKGRKSGSAGGTSLGEKEQFLAQAAEQVVEPATESPTNLVCARERKEERSEPSACVRSLLIQRPKDLCDEHGSPEAHELQLAHLSTHLSNLLYQQKSGFVLCKHNYFNYSPISLTSTHNFSDLSQIISDWIVDSGATDHVTWEQNKLQNLTKLNEPQHVTVANGNIVQICGTGTTNLFDNKVNNILYLPDFNSNLLSVSKIT